MNVGSFEGCLVGEEFAYGCTGISTALEGSGLGVSSFCNVFYLCKIKVFKIFYSKLL